ncbi:MAG TPA: S9 family peptidase [Terriglobales bacterium]|nr:S9 family peptidase [Terriglobales bacterium]
MNRFIRRMVICCVLVPLAGAQSPNASTKKSLTIEAIFAPGGIAGRPPETIQWTPDHTKFSYIQRDDSGEHGELWSVDATTGQKALLVSESKLATLAPPVEKIKDEREMERITRYDVDPYHWAPDSKHLLFVPQGQLWLYSLESGTAVQLSASSDPNGDPKFSPDGSRLAYVRKHNLYVRHVSSGSETQLTREKDDKDKDKDEKKKDENLLNGEVDWVYAEELDVRSNYFWSPDSKSIVFLRMDETRVPTYPITDWMPTHPTVDMQKYPQAGDPNPTVRLGVVSASGGDIKWISLPDDADTYIPRFGWVRDGILWAEVLNRAQNHVDLYFIEARSGRSRNVLSETTLNAWVNVNDDMRILQSGDHFLWSSWRDGTTQLYLYSFDKENPLARDAQLARQLTKGDFEMLGVEAVDETDSKVYFICNKDDPRQRQLYVVKLDGSGTDFERISTEDGTHHVTFADDGKHYVDEFSALMTPPRLRFCSTGGNCEKLWNSRSVDDYGLTAPKFLEFKADDGTILYGELVLPSESAPANKIPLLVNIYGGPAAQLVRNKWIEDWTGSSGLFHQLLAQRGFAIFTVDNRGTPARDRKFMTAVRHQFGAIELKDQLTALDQLFAQYPQLDRNRVGIWGWSNGASMTLYAMTHSNMFKAGAAVAPVTDWRNYDSIYTERYNGLPTDKDTTSYTDLNLPKVADKLFGSLLLAHGTGDDNVHFQNSIQMVDALTKAGRQFQFMIYPNKTHSIRGSEDRDHLFHLIQDHFEHELK